MINKSERDIVQEKKGDKIWVSEIGQWVLFLKKRVIIKINLPQKRTRV